jgi:hypothetical protein
MGEYTAPITGNVVYDAKLKEYFFSNPSLNEVEAYSSADGHRVGAVSVPGPLGLSVSPDGAELAVGSTTPHVYIVNPATLHVTQVVEIPASLTPPSTGGYVPAIPYLMASGPMLFEMAYPQVQGAGSEGRMFAYDRAAGTFVKADPAGAAVGVDGGMPARSLDGQYLAVPTLGQKALQVALYSAAAQDYVGTTAGLPNLQRVAVNSDGSQFAVSDGSHITFWGRDLQQQSQYATGDKSIMYSRDGKYLYAEELFDVLALDARTGSPAGYQGLSIGTLWPGSLTDVDDSGRVVGSSDIGGFVASMGQLQQAPPSMPDFRGGGYGTSIGNPNEGPLKGSTQVQFVPESTGSGAADGMGPSTEAYFGLTGATNDVVGPFPSSSDGRNFLTATTPAASAPGPVTVLLTDANNNAILLPRAFSYGPHVNWLDPNAIPPQGGVVSSLSADGLVPFAPNATVTVGGATAGVGSGGAGILVDMPGGKPGWADLTLSLGDGTQETVKNAVQYLAQYATLTGPTAFTAAVYDPKRDRFYLTAGNVVAVFDVATQKLLQPLQSAAVSGTAVLGRLAITPDNAKLVVGDPTDNTLVVFDLVDGSSAAVRVSMPGDGVGPWSWPLEVAAIKGHRAFVIPGYWLGVRDVDLDAMMARLRTDISMGQPFSVSPATVASTSDGSEAVLGGAGPGYVAPWFVWKYDANSDRFSAPVSSYQSQADFVAVNGDGTVADVGATTLNADLTPVGPQQYVGVLARLTAGGGLRYAGAQQVNVSDTRNGRSILNLPSLGDWVTALAIDGSGKKILVCAGKTLNYYELSVVPLAVGTVTPAAAAPGANVALRGDGFVSTTAVTIGGKSAVCTATDAQTLQCGVPNVPPGMAPLTVSNPDGQSYSTEGVLRVE